MRTVLIGAVACLTVGTFFGAERMISSNANAVALEQKAATQAALAAQLKQANADFALEIAEMEEAGASNAAQIDTLNTTVQSITAKRDELFLQLITAQDEAAINLERVAEVEVMYDGMVEKAAQQGAVLAKKDVELDAFRASTNNLANEEGQLAAELAALSEELETRDQMIATLEEAIEAAKAAQPVETAEPNAELAELNAEAAEELANANSQIGELTVSLDEATDALSERDAVIAALETELSETKVEAETVEAPVASEPVASESEQTAKIDSLDAQIADLTQLVEEQTSAIANLRLGFGDGPVEPMEMAEVCIARASGILESTQITFGTGTTSITGDSIATLESLRDLAIGCENDEVVIEIGGHTDSFGAEADNQALSEARAESVKEFLVQRGIPAENMIAIGFGETKPVATNETKTGRAANRRITFMWQMREPLEPVSDTVDG